MMMMMTFLIAHYFRYYKNNGEWLID